MIIGNLKKQLLRRSECSENIDAPKTFCSEKVTAALNELLWGSSCSAEMFTMKK